MVRQSDSFATWMRWSLRWRAATVCLEGVPGSGKRGDASVRFPLVSAAGRLAGSGGAAPRGSPEDPRVVGDGDEFGPGSAAIATRGAVGARTVDDAGGRRLRGLLTPDGSVTVWFAVVGAARLGGRRIHVSSPWEGWVVGGRSPPGELAGPGLPSLSRGGESGLRAGAGPRCPFPRRDLRGLSVILESERRLRGLAPYCSSFRAMAAPSLSPWSGFVSPVFGSSVAIEGGCGGGGGFSRRRVR